MLLVILRHGIAIDATAPDCANDAARWLTPKGIRRTTAACEGLRALGIAPDPILTSPLVRAQETAAIAAKVLGGTLEVTDTLRGGVQTAAAFEALGGLTAETVLCVGHAPQLDLLARHALADSEIALAFLKKAGAIAIEFDGQAAPGGGTLLWQHQPRSLRELGSA